ncbi:MAG: GNAT family N-acetyltransferase [Clostridia bacterium]|nr:GNAT family N-acetyltransferase [Clostridia bacterium]
MDQLECRLIDYGSDNYKAELALRDRVLRQPLGLSLYDEKLDKERFDRHIGAFMGDRLVGVLILTELTPEDIKMRQVAVGEALQGQGIGTALVSFAEEYARERGAARIVLHARKTAVPFYTKLGYKIIGETFIEVGLPHLKMLKVL